MRTQPKPDTDQSLPQVIRKSLLWKKITTTSQYREAILNIRDTARAFGEKVSTSLPEYTDHSVAHMDAMWGITDHILTESEIQTLNEGEALLLAASFYVHDLGMSLASTRAGMDEIRRTNAYRAAHSRFSHLYPNDPSGADMRAIKEATRESHAEFAVKLATEKIPSLDRFLIENSDFRHRWAYLIGQVAESHYWGLDEIGRTLGSKGQIPGPDKDTLDLAFTACILRIVDLAHISKDRAPRLERALRTGITPESEIHWDAQENITGPTRVGDLLVYGCSEPLKNTKAWWKFYSMAVELDIEIRSVFDYLQSRTISADRFSLNGVKGVETPASFNRYVQLPPNVAPVDIRVQPDSMERVVELLGGRHIYGRDQLAPIRELLQNARDAIELRLAFDRASEKPLFEPRIAVCLERRDGRSSLTVSDNGIGMSKSVVRKYLVGVGANFWTSLDFYRQFGPAIDSGFQPIGKFGIGFLSVFMLGDHVEVETEASGGTRIELTLHGLGTRGELTERPPTGRIGTEIRITLKREFERFSRNLIEIVRSRAPMLQIPIVIKVDDEGTVKTNSIAPRWWLEAPEDTLLSFLRTWRDFAYSGKEETPGRDDDSMFYLHEYYYGRRVDFGGKSTVSGWPRSNPQYQNDSERLISMGGKPAFGVLRCSQGIAVDLIPTPDITGIIDVGPTELTVSRETVADSPDERRPGRLSRSRASVEQKLIGDLLPSVVSKVNDLSQYGMLPARIGFLRGLASVFGPDLLDAAELKWIPVTEPPGNLVLRSKRELVDELQNYRRIVLAAGASQGEAYAASSQQLDAAVLSKALLIAIGEAEARVTYDVESTLEREGRGSPIGGPLDSVLETTKQDGDGLILISFLLKCVSEGWGMAIAALRSQKWFIDYKNNVLWVTLENHSKP